MPTNKNPVSEPTPLSDGEKELERRRGLIPTDFERVTISFKTPYELFISKGILIRLAYDLNAYLQFHPLDAGVFANSAVFTVRPDGLPVVLTDLAVCCLGSFFAHSKVRFKKGLKLEPEFWKGDTMGDFLAQRRERVAQHARIIAQIGEIPRLLGELKEMIDDPELLDEDPSVISRPQEPLN
jgi:hypothetical protein